MKLSLNWKYLILASICLCLQTSIFAQKTTSAPPKFAPIYNLKKSLVIDGNADDWPIPAMVFLNSKDGKAQMRFAADGNNFYALVEVEDKSPLKNGADRPEEMFKGGDTVAFYFQIGKGNEQRIAVCQRNGKDEVYVYRNFIARKDNSKPYTFSSPVGDTKFKYVAPAKNAKVAFKKFDGKGYVVEVCFPWRDTLGNWPHRPKEPFRFDAQVVFSDSGGTQNAGAAWLFSREGPGLTIEDLPTEAKLYPDTWGKTEYVSDIVVSAGKPTLAITKPEGGTEIEVDLPRSGRLTLNITDQNGWILRELVQAKKYSPGKHNIYWDGRDRYGDALPPGKYNWKALLFDGMQTKFLGSVGNSGRPPYRTPDGLGSMGGQHGKTKSVAHDAGGVYMSNATQEGPPVMRKIDPLTGKAFWSRSAGGFKSVEAVAASENMACFINGLGKKEKFGRDLVRIDPESGKDLKMESGTARVNLDEAKGEQQASGLTIVDGKAWISIQKKNLIISVDLNSGKKGKQISITSPQGLARKDTKTLLVCSGSDVLKVDTATGNKTPVLTKLEAPIAVCLDAKGNIFVSELGTSQRVRKYSPDGKKLLATWGKKGGKTNQQIPYDRMAFRNITGMTVGPKGNIWLAESDSLVKRFIKLDANGKWLEDFYGPVAYNTFGPDLDDFSIVYYMVAGGCFVETKIDYEQYQKNPMDPANAWHLTNIHDLSLAADGKTVNETMRNVAKTGYGHVIVFKADNGHRYLFRFSKHNRAAAPIGAGLWIEKDKHWVPCAFISRDTKNFKSWADKNSDGLIQPEEEYQDLPIDQASWVDRNLTLHGYKGKLAPASISDAGVPNYAGGKFKPYLNEGEKDFIGDQWTFFSRAQDDVVYYISNHGPHRHLSFWDRATENRLIKVKDGKAQWVLGEHSPRPRFTELSTNSGVAGAQDGVVLVQNIEPCNYVAFSEDGFVLGDIMVNKEGVHPHVGPYVINIESFTGLYVKDPKTQKNVLFAVSSGDDRILEVTGPGKTNRMQGTVNLANVTPDKPGQFQIPYSSWYGNTSRGQGVNGSDTEWRPNVQQVSIMNKKQVVGDVKLRRDAGNLCLFATILDHKMTVGDGIKLILANNPQGNEKYELTLTLDRGKSKKDKEEKWIAKPAMLKDGKPVAGKIAAAVQPRWLDLGYRIEAEIPLSMLPELSEKRKQTFRREIKKTKSMGNITEELPDLKTPVFIDLQIIGSEQSGSLSNGKALPKADIPKD